MWEQELWDRVHTFSHKNFNEVSLYEDWSDWPAAPESQKIVWIRKESFHVEANGKKIQLKKVMIQTGQTDQYWWNYNKLPPSGQRVTDWDAEKPLHIIPFLQVRWKMFCFHSWLIENGPMSTHFWTTWFDAQFQKTILWIFDWVVVLHTQG